MTSLAISTQQSLKIHRTGKKFRDYSGLDTAKIPVALIGIAHDCGLREPEDHGVLKRIAKILTSEFKDFSLEEMQLAAVKYATNQLDFKDSSYQIFSLKFASSILTSYRKYRNEALFQEQKEKEREERKAEEVADFERRKKMTPSWVLIARSKVLTAYNKAVEKRKKIELDTESGEKVFKILFQNNFFSVSKEETDYFRTKAYEELKKSFKGAEKLSRAFEELKRGKKSYDEETDVFKNKIREKASCLFLQEWLQEQIKEGKKFGDIFPV